VKKRRVRSNAAGPSKHRAAGIKGRAAGGPASDPSRAAAPALRAVPAQLAGQAAPAGVPVVAREVFAGSQNLTKALNSAGIPCLPFDIQLGGDLHDLAKEATVQRLAADPVQYAHYAPPCNPYSIARWPKVRSRAWPQGLPDLTGKARSVVDLANTLSRNTVRLLRLHCQRGVSWSCENPASSLLWHTQEFKQLASDYNLDRVSLDMCRFGARYRKRTVLLTWDPQGAGFLHTLNRRCACKKPHKILANWGERGAGIPTKNGCAAYPPALCRAWARAVQRHLKV